MKRRGSRISSDLSFLSSCLLIAFHRTVEARFGPCDEQFRELNLAVCYEYIKMAAESPDMYWFGSTFRSRCEGDTNPRSSFCFNPVPPGAPRFSFKSLGSRLFIDDNFQSARYLRQLNNSIEVKYDSWPGWIEGCDSSQFSPMRYIFDVNPNMVPARAFSVRNRPQVVVDGCNDFTPCTLVLYDAAMGTLHNIWPNWPRTNVRVAVNERVTMPKPHKRRCPLSNDSSLRYHKRLKELSDNEALNRKEKDRVRKAEARKSMSENDLQARRTAARERYTIATGHMTDPEIQTQREVDRVRRTQARESMSEDQIQARRDSDRVSKAQMREQMSEDEIRTRREGDRERWAQTREDMNEQEREEYRAAKRERESRERRDQRRVKNRGFMARRVPDFVTLPIEQSYFGSLNDPNSTVTCSFCGAVKFEAHQNRHSSCCNKGLINIPMFPNHPEAFRALWENDNPKYRIVKKHVRALNNTMAMASLQAKAAPVPGGGYTPTVVIQGKTYARMGSLIPDDGESPLFSQLYVLDPSIQAPEEEIRFQNMSLPRSTPETEKNVLRQVIVTCQDTLADCNPYVKDFKTAAEIARETNPETLFIRIDDTKRPTNDHARRYNAGTQEISVLTDDEIANCQKDRAFVVRLKGGGLREIQDTHRSADALQFPLLFPYGTDGWHMGLRKKNGKPITPLEFYSFHIQTRFSPGSLQVAPSPDVSLLRMAKLTHVYFCFSQSRIENQRLKFIAHNQKELRGASYKRICEDVHAHRNNETAGALKSGEQVILPPSFVGSPRYYHNHFQDAMAICRKFHKPDFFITFTCNPYWKEIVESLLPGQIPADRPDIMADVFHIKLKELMKHLKDGYLGCVAAHMHVIEFQKRGLPHAHILLILKNENRILTAEEVDEIISAEIPPDPTSYPEGPERQRAEELQDIVLQNMIHTCGPRCQRDGDQGIVQNQSSNDGDNTDQPTPRVTSPRQCTKGYPKQFCSKTEWEDNAFHPIYRRRGPDEGGRQVTKGSKTIDNRSVVPYSPILSWMFKAHINVELCVSPTCAKYLFKYCTKGPDRAMASVGYNEVDDFQNFRSLGASEAVWKLRQYEVTERYPAVTALRIHLPGENYVIYEEGTEEEVVGRGEKRTELDAFFAYNAAHPGTECKYVDFPTHFVLKNKKEWTERKRNKDGGMIGRIHVVHPVHSPETFCLRILLNDDHCKGKTSFDDLRTVNGEVLETYKQVCERLGLLKDDAEWNSTLEEACATMFPRLIRNLFSVIILFCEPKNPRELFFNHVEHMWEDFQRSHPAATNDMLTAFVLSDIEERLEYAGHSLAAFGLPPVLRDLIEEAFRSENITEEDHQIEKIAVVLQEELGFDMEDMEAYAAERIPKLTPSQKAVFNRVKSCVENKQPLTLFIDARGGTGKTHTINTTLAYVRSRNDEKTICLAVATSGIAATLLLQGRTMHSRFKVPLNADKDKTVCFKIKRTDYVADVIRQAALIVWDESPMAHRHILEGLDRLLRDLMYDDRPFGGKIIVLAGDFRQILPVVVRGNRSQITGASIKYSPLWKHFETMELKENMRIGANPSLRLEDFNRFQVSLGNGTLPIVEYPDTIRLPEQFVFEIKDETTQSRLDAMMDFVDTVFPRMITKLKGPEDEFIQYAAERAILAPRNDMVDRINYLISKKFPGEAVIFKGADCTVEVDDAMRFPVEYLNSLTPAGLPPHMLELKLGMILMLLRNLNPKEGLCNGTRLILKSTTANLLICRVASGDHRGKTVLIPRIELWQKDGDFPFEWKRRQFPVRPAFAMTINKSQGQTFKRVGVWLEDPAFTHGQLYVAASRVGSPSNLIIAVKQSAEGCTRNVVYREILRPRK